MIIPFGCRLYRRYYLPRIYLDRGQGTGRWIIGIYWLFAPFGRCYWFIDWTGYLAGER